MRPPRSLASLLWHRVTRNRSILGYSSALHRALLVVLVVKGDVHVNVPHTFAVQAANLMLVSTEQILDYAHSYSPVRHPIFGRLSLGRRHETSRGVHGAPSHIRTTAPLASKASLFQTALELRKVYLAVRLAAATAATMSEAPATKAVKKDKTLWIQTSEKASVWDHTKMLRCYRCRPTSHSRHSMFAYTMMTHCPFMCSQY